MVMWLDFFALQSFAAVKRLEFSWTLAQAFLSLVDVLRYDSMAQKLKYYIDVSILQQPFSLDNLGFYLFEQIYCLHYRL